MKRIHLSLIVALSSLFFTLNSCKKDKTSDDTTDLTSQVTTQSDDQAMFSAEEDAVSDDVNGVVESNGSFAGKTNGDTCSTSISVDTTGNEKKITITYNGSNCNGTRTRQGQIIASIPKTQKWKNAGAVLTVQINNLKITRVSDGKSVTLNGTKTITNVNGRLIRELAIPATGVTTVVHTVASSNMSATFDNGTARQWQIAKRRTFTFSNGFVVSIAGTGGTTGDVAVWGTNRLNQDFATRIIDPIVLKEACGFRVGSGKIIHTKLTRDITVTFGLDASGSPTGCPGTNPYYYKAEWTALNGTAKSVIRPY